MMANYYAVDQKNRPCVALTMPQIHANSTIDRIELLFFNALSATANSIESGILDSIGEVLNKDRSTVETILVSKHLHYSIYNIALKKSSEFHYILLRNGEKLKNRPYHTVASICAQAESLSIACSILTKYGPEINYDLSKSGNDAYRNKDFLHYLIRTARTQALKSRLCKSRMREGKTF